MSYNKYQRLVHQVSTDGGRSWTTAVPVQYAKGDLIERNSLDCQPSYRWVVMSGEFICGGTEGFDKYEKLKKQVSLDGGTTWTDTVPLETQAGNLIQRNSVDCGAEPEYKWEVDHNRIVCDGTTAYYAIVEYVSYDNRATWTETGNVQKSTVVYQENYSDCIQTVYRWIATGGYVCVGTSKYAEEKQQVSYNSGSTWTDTGSTRAGSLIENNSVDCGVENVEWRNTNEYICLDGTSQLRWVVSDTTICIGVNKYAVEKEQSSDDGGVTWIDTGTTRTGSMIEEYSFDCGFTDIRWVTVEGEYVCDGTTKYSVEKEQTTTDGVNWTDTGNIRNGSVIAYGDEDCGGTTDVRWVTVEGEYVCDGIRKYNKEKEQVSYDGGVWSDTGNTRRGTIVLDFYSEDCGAVTRWIPVNDEYICVDGNLYEMERIQYSTDDGETWIDGIYIRKTNIIKYNTNCSDSWEFIRSGAGTEEFTFVAWTENNTSLYAPPTPFENVLNALSARLLSPGLMDSADLTEFNDMTLGEKSQLVNVEKMASWDVSNILKFDRLFSGAGKLTDVSSINGWSFNSGGTSFMNCFQGMKSLVTGPNLTIPALSNGFGMFADSTAMSYVNLSNVTPAPGADLIRMFYNCTSLNIPASELSLFLSKIRGYSNVSQMFSGCESLSGDIIVENAELGYGFDFNAGNITSIIYRNCDFTVQPGNYKNITTAGNNTINSIRIEGVKESVCDIARSHIFSALRVVTCIDCGGLSLGGEVTSTLHTSNTPLVERIVFSGNYTDGNEHPLILSMHSETVNPLIIDTGNLYVAPIENSTKNGLQLDIYNTHSGNSFDISTIGTTREIYVRGASCILNIDNLEYNGSTVTKSYSPISVPNGSVIYARNIGPRLTEGLSHIGSDVTVITT